MKFSEARKELVEIAREADRKGLVTGSVGNLSVRVEDDLVLISSHSSYFGRIKEEEFVLVDLTGRKKEKSDYEPSSEVKMHLMIYQRRDDVRSIIHTHSPYASAYAYLKRPLKAVNPETVYKLGHVPIVPYFPSGTKEFAQAVAAEFGRGANVVLLEKHGVVAASTTLLDALNLAELLEESARINYLVDMLGAVYGDRKLRR